MTARSEPGPQTAAPPAGGTPPAALVAGLTQAVWLSPEGEIESLSPSEAARRARTAPPLVCHARTTARRLGVEPFAAYDLLELYAFVRPASFCPPTPRGLALALGLPAPAGHDAQALALPLAAERLLRELAAQRAEPRAAALAFAMARAGWLWGPAVVAALGGPGAAGRVEHPFAVWQELPEWEERAPEAQPGSRPVAPEAARRRLAELLGEGAEARPQQADYASAAAAAFQPREREGEPCLVLAEAGTGVGKTLGYIAPASLWSELNEAPVWLSTYTRNLQRQIDGELDRLFPEPAEKRRKVVVRKGRENYFCLLNYAERVRALAGDPGGQSREAAVAYGLLARWAARSRDGDMVGGDFPGWLGDLVGRGRSLGLTDRRGECLYSACEFYRNCFIERSVRRARQAELVVANHALVMIQAALGAGEEGRLPTRYVFDEGHHLFEAADNAFAAHLSGRESQELRRWLLGAESGRGAAASRRRGLKRRLEELLADDEALQATVEEALRAARALPGEGWHTRLAEGRAQGPLEAFLLLVRQQVFARAQKAGEGYSLECEPQPPVEGLVEAAAALDAALARLQQPLGALQRRLAGKLEAESEELDSDQRRRIEALVRGLERRGARQLAAWRDMLGCLKAETPAAFVDWLAVERIDGLEVDIGYFRHWVDPTEPFAETVLMPAHGALVTSATLTDKSGETERDWAAAEARSGAAHLPAPAIRAQVLSPFDYGAQTRVFVITDVRKDDLAQVAAAVRALFLAAGGGALGLFTAISRLKAVHARIAGALEQAGLDLYAQHLDGLDVSTLVEIFRAEPDSCLLGTDAVRDGVDVPGEALRLIVFDRVPWPRPDLRHKARRARFGGRHYDDRLTRLRLRQAYGRLVRRGDDRGVFVLLDPMMPSRLATAFPDGVALSRLGLAEALAEIRAFFQPMPK